MTSKFLTRQDLHPPSTPQGPALSLQDRDLGRKVVVVNGSSPVVSKAGVAGQVLGGWTGR